MWPVKYPYSERMVYSELDDGPNALIRNETCNGSYVDEITGDMRKVIEWAWLNPESPSEIHDTAARLLQQPSLAHGFAT